MSEDIKVVKVFEDNVLVNTKAFVKENDCQKFVEFTIRQHLQSFRGGERAYKLKELIYNAERKFKNARKSQKFKNARKSQNELESIKLTPPKALRIQINRL